MNVAPIRVTTVEDLERRVAERTAELQESEARYRRIVKATHSFVFTVMTQGDCTTRTIHEGGVEEVTGYSAREYAEDPELWRKMIHPEDLAVVLQHIESLRSGAPLSVIEHRIIHKDGTTQWIRNTSVARTRAGDGPHGYDGLITDITALKLAEQQRDELLASLHKMACHDSMTGLPNRRGFNEEFRRVWNLSCRHPFPVGLLIVDVDHFKSVNDTYGHLVGDAVIKEYAALIPFALRDTDTVCRHAGDELVVILPWADMDETRRIGERILQKVREYIFCHGEHDIKLTVSIGAYGQYPGADRTVERFLGLADRALYRAKQSGRNRLCCPTESHRRDDVEADSDATAHAREGESQGLVLIVDDDPVILVLLERMLEHEQFRVLAASSIHEALEIAKSEKNTIDVALIDLVLNDESGLELIGLLKEQDDLLVPLVITGHASMDGAIEALRTGVYDFIQKPVSLPQLSLLMRRAIGHRRLLLQNRRYQKHLEAMVRQRGRSLTRALEQEKKSYQFTLEAMAAMIEAREQMTGEHCRRVAQIAVILAAEMGATTEELEQIRSGALLHDIGKIAIPDSVLLKPGPLTEEEWEVMKSHPRVGYQIIASSPALKQAADIVLSHQERYDGSGYPQGLKGAEICLGARIFAVVDAYDAMRSERSYSSSFTPEETLAEILRHKGTQFDPYVVDALVSCQHLLEAEGRWNRI